MKWFPQSRCETKETTQRRCDTKELTSRNKQDMENHTQRCDTKWFTQVRCETKETTQMRCDTNNFTHTHTHPHTHTHTHPPPPTKNQTSHKRDVHKINIHMEFENVMLLIRKREMWTKHTLMWWNKKSQQWIQSLENEHNASICVSRKISQKVEEK